VGGSPGRGRLSGVRGQPAGGGPLPRPPPRLGGQSDASDAKLLADLVRTDRHNHRPIAGDSLDTEAIKVLARAHQSLIWARTRHTNAMRSALREYYPAALLAFEDLAHGDALGVLGRAPTPEQGAHLDLPAIQSALNAVGANATSPPVPAKSGPRYGLSSWPLLARSPRRSAPPPAPRWASSPS
jgi:hypothetical protein